VTDNTSTITRDGVLGYDGTEVITIDQATGAELTRYHVAGKEEAVEAVAAARSVSGLWWDLGFEGRAERLHAWQREIALSGEEGAALIHAENGKPTDDARSEVLALLQHLQFALGNAERVLARRDVPAASVAPNQRAWVEYHPYGVVGVIGPWNFPLMTPGAIVINALAAGNAVILKPSHITPAVAEWLVRTWRRAVPGFPTVLQHLIRYAATGSADGAEPSRSPSAGPNGGSGAMGSIWRKSCVLSLSKRRSPFLVRSGRRVRSASVCRYRTR
jgi:aldehyde dehydrogenase (NAD+)